MTNLLNLLAAIALLVWGTHIVRTGIVRLFGENLRNILAHSLSNRFCSMLAGLAVTSLVQSSTATAVIISSFVGSGWVGLAAGLAVMLGAEVGTSLMTVVFSFDLSWLSPLLIFVGVVLFISSAKTTVGRIGSVAIGFGLITLSLKLIVSATAPMIESPAVRSLIISLPQEILLEIVLGALLTMACYSSLAFVLLTATLAASGLVPVVMALGLVLGANIGSGILAMLTSSGPPTVRLRLPLASLMFKLAGCAIATPFIPTIHALLDGEFASAHAQVIAFHLGFNVIRAALFIAVTGPMASLVERLLPAPAPSVGSARPRHLDPSALQTPSLAISCAAREALHQADVVETMLNGILPVLRDNDLALAEQLRKMDDTVDQLYSAIKFYLTQISREALSESEGRRWTDVVSFTINMEQIGDIAEKIIQDIEDRKIRHNLSLSEAGMAEISHLHERLIANLRLGMSVYLEGNLSNAKQLLEEKARFRDLQHQYAASHIARLRDNTLSSIETSSLHIDLISDLKRINSHICSIAYPLLDSVGVLPHSRFAEKSLSQSLG